MRKLFIILLMSFILASFTFNIYADISTYITSYSMEEEQGGEARLVFVLTVEPTTSNVSLYLPYRSTNTIDKNGVRSYISFIFTDNTSSTLDWGDTFGNNFDFGNQPGCPNCPLLELDLEYFSGKQPKTIAFSFTQTFNYDDTPIGFLEQYINEVQVYVDVLNNRVIYYSGGEVYLNTIFATVPLRPTNPTPPEGYEFQYWALGNGNPYLFTAVSEDMLKDGVLYLYSVFRPTTSTPEINEPTTQVPQSLRDILALVRLDNTAGYGVAYVIVAIIIIVILIYFFNASAMVLVVVELLWLVLAFVIGLLSIWVSIVVGLFIILVILYSMKVNL